jgi:hypothetical protein
MVDLHLNPVDYFLFIVSIVSCQQLKGREHDLALAGLQPRLVLTHPYPGIPRCLNSCTLFVERGVYELWLPIPTMFCYAIHTVAAQPSHVNTRVYAKE